MKNFIVLTLLLVSSCVFAQNDSISPMEREMIIQINILRSNPKSYIPYVKEYISEQTEIIKEQELMIEKYKGVNKKSVLTTTTTVTTFTYNVTYKNVAENTKLRELIIKTCNKNILLANELIGVLNTTPSVPKLVLDTKLYKVSKTHLKFLTAENKFCHECASNGSFIERTKHLSYISVGENIVVNRGVIRSLILLLLDNGNPNRGHRKNLLSIGKDRKWTYISVAINDSIVVQNFAD